GEEGASIFFETFLHSGAGAWSEQERALYPGLSTFRGVRVLKEELRKLAGSDPDLPVLLANRSVQLMKLASSLLFQQCRNVLVTDIGWPPYHEILAFEGAQRGRALTTVPIREIEV